jgi:predicted nucleotidyltransferase
MVNLSIKNNFSIDDLEFNTKLLKPKDRLFPKFWRQGSLNPIVARKLMAIADQIIKSLQLDSNVEDVIITGSIASYNWHELSDIDLHIMLDFEKIDKNFDLVKRMLDQTRINWNKKHNIRIADKEVEIYFQHYTEPHEANGIWSLELEKWLATPVKLNPELDLKTTEKKAEAIAQSIEHVQDMISKSEYKEAYEYADKIKLKIAKMRQTGLANDGIFSPENLAFKMLRNSGLLEMLSTSKILAFDKMMGLEMENRKVKDQNFNEIWNNHTSS